MLLGSVAGPTGAHSVSRRSQMGRLRAVLERDSVLAGGKLRRTTRDLVKSDRVAITAGYRYPKETIPIESSGGGVGALLYISSTQGNEKDGALKLTAINGVLLLRLPE